MAAKDRLFAQFTMLNYLRGSRDRSVKEILSYLQENTEWGRKQLKAGAGDLGLRNVQNWLTDIRESPEFATQIEHREDSQNRRQFLYSSTTPTVGQIRRPTSGPPRRRSWFPGGRTRGSSSRPPVSVPARCGERRSLAGRAVRSAGGGAAVDRRARTQPRPRACRVRVSGDGKRAENPARVKRPCGSGTTIAKCRAIAGSAVRDAYAAPGQRDPSRRRIPGT